MKHAALLLVAACAPGVPDAPSFQQDVLPILAANCVRCHGYPQIGGAPIEFRLDSFESTVVTDGLPGDGNCGPPADPTIELQLCGAAQYAPLIAARVDDGSRPMPPRFPLEDFQIETLKRWADAPDRGAPRPDNEAPTLVIEDTDQTGAIVTVHARVEDADRDLVVGTLYAVVGARKRVVGSLRSGRLALTWDVTGVPAGTYPLAATLDDGAGQTDVTPGTIMIEVTP